MLNEYEVRSLFWGPYGRSSLSKGIPNDVLATNQISFYGNFYLGIGENRQPLAINVHAAYSTIVDFEV